MKIMLVISLFFSASIAFSNESLKIINTKKMIKQMIELEHRFDPDVTDFYSDTAIIKNKRTYPGGYVKELKLPAKKYKSIIRNVMPLAKLKGDTSELSNCTYKQEGNNVRVNCTRYSNLRKYFSPISILMGEENGKWVIKEELSESRPF